MLEAYEVDHLVVTCGEHIAAVVMKCLAQLLVFHQWPREQLAHTTLSKS